MPQLLSLRMSFPLFPFPLRIAHRCMAESPIQHRDKGLEQDMLTSQHSPKDQKHDDSDYNSHRDGDLQVLRVPRLETACQRLFSHITTAGFLTFAVSRKLPAWQFPLIQVPPYPESSDHQRLTNILVIVGENIPQGEPSINVDCSTMH